MSFRGRQRRLNALEKKFLLSASQLMARGGNVYLSDLFVLGAVKRVLGLSSGFRTLMTKRNITCCAGLLRMQIDTAARVNSLRLVDDRDEFCRLVLSGGRLDKQKDRDGHLLSDGYLIKKLALSFPWVQNVYKETSGFVHLSERHLHTSISRMDDETRTIHFAIGVDEPERSDDAYFEVMDAFFEATKMASDIIISYVEHRRSETA